MADPDPAAEDQRGLLRTNAGIVYLAGLVAIPFVIASLGLNLVFTVALLVLFVGVAFAVHRWRARRNPGRAGPGAISGTGVVAALRVFTLIQVVPYGRSHRNGPIIAEPKWADSPTRTLAAHMPASTVMATK